MPLASPGTVTSGAVGAVGGPTGIGRDEVVVAAAPGHECVVSSAIDQATALQIDDLVGEAVSTCDRR